jgi:hypothetical protein
MDKMYQSKGLENALLMQDAEVGFSYFLSSNGPLTTDFLPDKNPNKIQKGLK